MWYDPITRYTLGISLMFSFYWLSKRLVVSPLFAAGKLPNKSKNLIDTALLYIPGLGLLLLLIKDMPVLQVVPKNFSVLDYIVVFIAQFFAFALIGLFGIIETKIGLVSIKTLENQTTESNKGINAILLFAVVPFLEELLNRQLPSNILGTVDLRLYLYLSAIVFSLLHLQTGRIAVAVGMLYTGFLWAWVYASSGSLILCTVYHMLFNLMMVFIPDYLEKTKKGHGVYLACLAVMGTIGFLLFVFNFAHYIPPELTDGQSPWLSILGNWGFWVLVVICVFSYFYALKNIKAKGKLSDK